ncbi:MAG: PIN domain-containing protein [Nitrospirae bacterium]|nr:PIN domain-containing protein [Nitrospirota bacterium]MCL5237639.1 PIN domain-containing protein [Nitrospirota bacterium]
MNKVILDANYILAILDQTDIHHKPAIDIDDKIQAVFDEILYLDCVINEVVSVTIKRLKERKKKELIPDYLKRLHQLIPKTSITWIYPEIEDYYEEVLKTVIDSHGNLNFHDALIVVIANEFEISHIVSFDKGFDKTELKRIKDAGDI